MKLTITDDDIVRVCVRVVDEPMPAPNSKPVPCSECDVPVWRASNQRMIHPETGEEVVENYCLCMMCFFQHQAQQDQPAQMIPPNLVDLLKEFFPEGEDSDE